MQIANNGIFSFNQAYSHWAPEPFPGTSSTVQNSHLVTPFWDDVDISGEDGGSIYYQVHTSTAGNPQSVELLDQVNGFIQSGWNSEFVGVWMLVAVWDEVHPYPHGTFPNPTVFPDVLEVGIHTACSEWLFSPVNDGSCT